MTRHVVLVAGPPCGGKSTYVEQRARPGELVVCFDLLARRAGSANRHRHTAAQRAVAGEAFRRLCESLPDRPGGAWVIRCAADPQERAELAATIRADQVVVLVPALATALARAQSARRGQHVVAAIHRWYATYEPRPDELLLPRPAPAW